MEQHNHPPLILEVFSDWLIRLFRAWRIPFLASLIWGFLGYMFAFTNKLVNTFFHNLCELFVSEIVRDEAYPCNMQQFRIACIQCKHRKDKHNQIHRLTVLEQELCTGQNFQFSLSYPNGKILLSMVCASAHYIFVSSYYLL